MHRVAEGEQPEAVPVVQRPDQRAERLAGLVHLLAGHRARDVHHDGQVARLGDALQAARGQREHRVAVLSRRAVRGHGEADARARERQEDRQLALQRVVQTNHQAPVAARAPERVRGREGLQGE